MTIIRRLCSLFINSLYNLFPLSLVSKLVNNCLFQLTKLSFCVLSVSQSVSQSVCETLGDSVSELVSDSVRDLVK